MQSFTFGTTPADTVREAFTRELGTSPYEITTPMGSDDELVLGEMMPLGITREPMGYRARWSLTCDQLLELLQNLLEADTEDGERAWSWRSGILETLGIEEI